MNLVYRAAEGVEDLAVGECTIRGARDVANTKRFWNLWFYVARETDGVAELFAVPIAPGGAYTETGPGGRTWGLTQTAPGTWQVSPSIDVPSDADVQRIEAGLAREDRSVWHQTPALVSVPSGERWAAGLPPSYPGFPGGGEVAARGSAPPLPRVALPAPPPLPPSVDPETALFLARFNAQQRAQAKK